MNKTDSFGILFLRLGASLSMIPHGWAKLEMLFSGGAQNFNPIGIGGTFSLLLCCFAEFICSILIGLGILTRLAATILAINMSVAIYVLISTDAQWSSSIELAFLYFAIFLTLMLTDGGYYSLDRVIKKEEKIHSH